MFENSFSDNKRNNPRNSYYQNYQSQQGERNINYNSNTNKSSENYQGSNYRGRGGFNQISYSRGKGGYEQSSNYRGRGGYEQSTNYSRRDGYEQSSNYRGRGGYQQSSNYRGRGGYDRSDGGTGYQNRNYDTFNTNIDYSPKPEVYSYKWNLNLGNKFNRNQDISFKKKQEDTSYRQFNLKNKLDLDITNIGVFGNEEKFHFDNLNMEKNPVDEKEYMRFRNIYGEDFKSKITPLNKYFKNVLSICKIQKD